jgi:hypothetical protein
VLSAICAEKYCLQKSIPTLTVSGDSAGFFIEFSMSSSPNYLTEVVTQVGVEPSET